MPEEDDQSLSLARNVPDSHRLQFYKLQKILRLIDKNMTLVGTKATSGASDLYARLQQDSLATPSPRSQMDRNFY